MALGAAIQAALLDRRGQQGRRSRWCTRASRRSRSPRSCRRRTAGERGTLRPPVIGGPKPATPPAARRPLRRSPQPCAPRPRRHRLLRARGCSPEPPAHGRRSSPPGATRTRWSSTCRRRSRLAPVTRAADVPRAPAQPRGPAPPAALRRPAAPRAAAHRRDAAEPRRRDGGRLLRRPHRRQHAGPVRPHARLLDGQRRADGGHVRVAQGESKRFAENTFLGELELSGLARGARGARRRLP